MPITYNGTRLVNIYYNGTKVNDVYYNGEHVFGTGLSVSIPQFSGGVYNDTSSGTYTKTYQLPDNAVLLASSKITFKATNTIYRFSIHSTLSGTFSINLDRIPVCVYITDSKTGGGGELIGQFSDDAWTSYVYKYYGSTPPISASAYFTVSRSGNTVTLTYTKYFTGNHLVNSTLLYFSTIEGYLNYQI